MATRLVDARALLDPPTRVAKAFNVLLYGGYSVFYMFQPLLLARRATPSALIGITLAIRPIVGTAVTPLWSAAADAYRLHLPLHISGLTIGAFSRIIFCLVPVDPLPLIAAAILSEALICHVIPLADAAIFIGLELLGRPREEYSLQRLWGAAAAGTFLPLAGALMTASPEEAAWPVVLALTIGPLTLSACMAPRLWRIGKRDAPSLASHPSLQRGAAHSASCSLASPAERQPSSVEATPRRQARMRVRALHASTGGVLRCALFFCCGAFHALTEGFLFLYLSSIHGSELLDGVAITVTCASEVLVMAVAGRLLARYGVDACLALVLLCYTVRFGGYAMLRPGHAWLVLPFQLLHGITFGLYWTVGTTWAASCAPPGLEATLQGAFTALISAGQAAALLLGGQLFDRVGGASLYGGASVAAAVIAFVAVGLAVVSRAASMKLGAFSEDVSDTVLPANMLRSDVTVAMPSTRPASATTP
jgi:hypothetical protein